MSKAIFGKDIVGMGDIEELRKSLIRKKDLLAVSDLGAGSRKFGVARNSPKPGQSHLRRIDDLVRHTSVNAKKGQLLARIAAYLDSPLVIELGTGLGFSSLYLGKACPNARILTCEGSAEIADLARANIDQLGLGNVEVSSDSFATWLPATLNQTSTDLLLFIDGDHRGNSLIRYCDTISQSSESARVIVIDDIHWSLDMFRAWNKIKKLTINSLSLELFNTGILFLDYPVQSGHYVIRFI